AVTLHLEPLDPSDMRELLAGLAPELDDEIVEAVVARSDGIPLYAIELVGMVRDGATAVGSTSADRLAIPPSLRALVAARLDSLSVADPGPPQGGAGPREAVHT